MITCEKVQYGHFLFKHYDTESKALSESKDLSVEFHALFVQFHIRKRKYVYFAEDFSVQDFAKFHRKSLYATRRSLFRVTELKSNLVQTYIELSMGKFDLQNLFEYDDYKIKTFEKEYLSSVAKITSLNLKFSPLKIFEPKLMNLIQEY